MLVIGAGGLALQLLDDLETVFGKSLTFWSDRPLLTNSISKHFPVLQTEDAVLAHFQKEGPAFVIAVGGPANRKKLQAYFQHLGGVLTSFISPGARVSSYAKIESGTVVCSGVVIEPDVFAGPGSLINVGSIITHETYIGAYTELAPGVVIGGAAHIGEEVFVGLNATILPKITLGNAVVVGAGAVVVSSFPDNVIIKGTPAR